MASKSKTARRVLLGNSTDNIMKRYIPFLFLLLLLTVACASSTGSDETKVAKAVAQQQAVEPMAIVPIFSGDSAYRYIAQQVAFGPRVPNSEGHRLCGDFLEAAFRSYGADVIAQTTDITAYNGDVLKARNIIARFQPHKSERVLLCAHWDTRPWADSDPDPANHYKPYPGANDGGSGVGVLLEVARHLSKVPTQVGVDIVLFDAEDYGRHDAEWRDAVEGEETWALGSAYWARNPHVQGYKARYGILLDIVGAPNSKFFLEGYSMHYAPNVLRKVWNHAYRLGYSSLFPYAEGGVITDDHLNVNRILGIPCIDIINHDMDSPNGFGAHHHTMKDDMDWIDAATLKAVGQTVLSVIYSEK